MHPVKSNLGRFSSSFQGQTTESHVSDYNGHEIHVGCAITTRDVASEWHLNKSMITSSNGNNKSALFQAMTWRRQATGYQC